ncbi:uncharacterized protein LOC108664823 [Hyalella azteca]|uniref:Uncharacterized protein LOC108664823 n=1 Tax=Hyalella azteca TaxID=294128 RepID=A0A8B7MZK5_HYAAZ|nr:uncharacterized protein LOC108664823 [Hyalella azteca]
MDDLVEVDNTTSAWRLVVTPALRNDSGAYECQVNTRPKLSWTVTLNVRVPVALLEGPRELYIKSGSTLVLTCTATLHPEASSSVVWKHNGSAVSILSPRGGVSVETEKEGRQLMSRLSLVHAIASDAGNYTCEPHLVFPANVSVYVVEDEAPAAMAHDGSSSEQPSFLLVSLSLLLLAGAVSRTSSSRTIGITEINSSNSSKPRCKKSHYVHRTSISVMDEPEPVFYQQMITSKSPVVDFPTPLGACTRTFQIYFLKVTRSTENKIQKQSIYSAIEYPKGVKVSTVNLWQHKKQALEALKCDFEGKSTGTTGTALQKINLPCKNTVTCSFSAESNREIIPVFRKCFIITSIYHNAAMDALAPTLKEILLVELHEIDCACGVILRGMLETRNVSNEENKETFSEKLFYNFTFVEKFKGQELFLASISHLCWGRPDLGFGTEEFANRYFSFIRWNFCNALFGGRSD